VFGLARMRGTPDERATDFVGFSIARLETKPSQPFCLDCRGTYIPEYPGAIELQFLT